MIDRYITPTIGQYPLRSIRTEHPTSVAGRPTIQAPPERVWEVLTDATGYRHWNPSRFPATDRGRLRVRHDHDRDRLPHWCRHLTELEQVVLIQLSK